MLGPENVFCLLRMLHILNELQNTYTLEPNTVFHNLEISGSLGRALDLGPKGC